ncbi:MAG: hypothetical protein Q7R73_05255 [bacterium]|nr:hypothetical protein [bacterium]
MNTKLIEWVLRVAVAGEFFGHGMLALQGKKDWIAWFAKFGVDDPGLAAQFLFAIGVLDILVALIVLVKPTIRIALLWAVLWGFWTALLRPLVGVGWLDFVERWANWGAPLALLLMLGWPRNFREWFTK